MAVFSPTTRAVLNDLLDLLLIVGALWLLVF
jgi:hypothetical protein